MRLSAYACAMRCPVPTSSRMPKACYAMSGTDIAYAPRNNGMENGYAPSCAYARAMQCPVPA
eukprot:3941586-Rhodomonas_salina.2